MAQRSHSGQQSTQPDSLLAAPSNSQGESQNPSSSTFRSRVTNQDSQSSPQTRRVSIQDPLSINSQRLSIEDTTSVIGYHRASIQDPLSVTYSRQFHTRDAPPCFQSRLFSNQNPLLTTRTPLTNIRSVTCHSQLSVQSPKLSLQTSMSPVRARVDVPLSITHSPEASIKSVESIVWTSQETIRDSLSSSQTSQSILENNAQNLPSASFENNAGRYLGKYRLSHSQLPMGWWLLHEAKRISRQLNLLLSLASIVIIGLISLGQPWIHFQVPLAPLGDPGFRTIPIDTVFVVRCSDMACLHDSNVPLLDFSNVIITALTGTSLILGILFYLMQAREYLQEGMTYKLGCSFYLAWTGVFFFVMIGFLSYLNYINFWSLLANQAIWT